MDYTDGLLDGYIQRRFFEYIGGHFIRQGYWVYWLTFVKDLCWFSRKHISQIRYRTLIHKSDTNSWNFFRVGMKLICCPPPKNSVFDFDFGFRKWFRKWFEKMVLKMKCES
jgi:hypothetical protein